MGAVLVSERATISTGYNGTPSGVTDCVDGGCLRCASDVSPWEEYDACICVHAEMNAILLAGRRGTPTAGTSLYTEVRPCLSCLKELIQAGVVEIVFDQDFEYSNDREISYQRLVKESGMRLRKLSEPA
jgi:dCMP deaminase